MAKQIDIPQTMLTAAELADRARIHPEKLARLVRRKLITPVVVTESGISIFTTEQVSDLMRILGQEQMRGAMKKIVDKAIAKIATESLNKLLASKARKKNPKNTIKP